MKRAFYIFRKSFPVQLFILSIKKQHVLLFIWILFFLTVSNRLFSIYGISLLFIDPEYLGEGGYMCFALVGVGFGAFLVTWNLVMYILNSFRFPFLATLRWPLATFGINNSIIPLAFIITYLSYIVWYQQSNLLLPASEIALSVAGFIAGLCFMLLINAIYFQFTSKDIVNIIRKKRRTLRILKREIHKQKTAKYEDLEDAEFPFFVEYYINYKFRIQRTRNVEHYDKELLHEVFQQHHWNVVLIQLLSFATVLLIGFFIERPIFLLPSATNIFMSFAVLTSVYGLFKFWSGKWSTTAFIVALLLINIATMYNYMTYQNKAFGLDYTKGTKVYSNETLAALASTDNMKKDRATTLQILQNWKSKQSSHSKKPKMVILCASGGGHRAGMFAMAMLQKADSATHGALMKQTVLMTGASGGMMGIAYYRELYLQQKLGHHILPLSNEQYTYDVAKDLNGALTASITTNDLIYPFRSFKIGNNSYKKDRAYMWEYQFNINTRQYLKKRLQDYVQAEKKADIPIMLSYPVLTNDARYLFISSQPMRYMMKPYAADAVWARKNVIEPDAIDYVTFFEGYHPLEMPITTVIRMNATYPWILPNAVFPTQPEFTVMDAGIRENLGTGISVRFLQNFTNWINENTSGVIIVELRSLEKIEDFEALDHKSWFSKISNPFGTLSNNLTNLHDYNNDALLSNLNQELSVPVECIRFEYAPDKKSAKASMSFRLTQKEKRNIISSTDNVYNTTCLKNLIKLLK